MLKKRVHELAKELGMGNKEMIERLEKLGIAVKTSSSTLGEEELERVKRELYAQGPQEVVEQRIAPTVIRRRSVRPAVEGAAPQVEMTQKPEAIDTVPAQKQVAEEAKEVKEEVQPTQIKPISGRPVLQEIQKETPTPPQPPPPRSKLPTPAPKQPDKAALKKPVVQKVEIKQEPVQKPVKKPVKPEFIPPRIIFVPETVPKETEGAAAETGHVPMPDTPVKKPLPLSPDQPKRADVKEPAKPKEAAETTSPRPSPTRPLGHPVTRPTEAPPEIKMETRPVPAPPLVRTGVPLPAERPVREDISKRKGKKIVDIAPPERETSRKKALIKKITDKKVKFIEDIEVSERAVRLKEEKKLQPHQMKKTMITIPKAIKRRIKVGESITVADLAKKMGVKASEVIGKLLALGLMVTINQYIDRDTAGIIAAEFQYHVEAAFDEYEEIMQTAEPQAKNLRPRAPVVTVMGHVDHGKTSLLDAIRKTNVIEGEAGGITQAIGAYHVQIKGRDIVFLDTPGHEAFTAMRARGAQVTDIVVLVVAADDGVKEQTVEAINHAQEAKVPIIVAVNKIDKPGADPEKIKQTLTEYNLVAEEWGGETIFCEVSAKQKTGIENLLEMILLQAEVMELKADPDLPARGVVIESKLDRGRGPVATVLIQEGTLREGDAFVSKTEFGRVRILYNDQGLRIKEAGPSMPVEVIGFSGVPQVGAGFICVEDEKKAREISEYQTRKDREKELSASSKITLEQFYQRIKEGAKNFNVIIKGDVQGSVEALSEAFQKLSTPEVRLNIIHSATGTITETDVLLASASDAIIIGFNVRPDSRVTELAEQEGIDIKLYSIIYDAIADVKAAMEGALEPVYKEVVYGRAEVRNVFKITKVGTVAGCYLTEGKISRNLNVKLIRDGIVIYDGKINSLKRFKDDVREVVAGFECGISIEGYNDIKNGDIIEAYLQEKIDNRETVRGDKG